MTTATTLDATQAADLFHALSDPARVSIVASLRGGEQCVCELMTVVGAAQSRLSYHLKVLKEAGVVTDRREGRWSYYTLQPAALAAAAGVLAGLVGDVPGARAAGDRQSGELPSVVRVAMPVGGCCG